MMVREISGLIEETKAVLNGYGKEWKEDGLLMNINTWASNKGWLVDLLQAHPNWDERAYALVFDISVSRDINGYDVRDLLYKLAPIVRSACAADLDQLCVMDAISAACRHISTLIRDDETAALVKSISGVQCVAGQKTSRVINAICRKYGVDRYPGYNAVFAKLADALNPLQIRRKALLSVHPCDYLEMSGSANSWSSCHGLYGGSYQAGTLSYMNDECSMIFYTIDDEVRRPYHQASKRARQVFSYKDGILLQSRLYPQSGDHAARDEYRAIVQKAIADCLHKPNLWALHKSQEMVNRYITTDGDALHYPDYECSEFRANVSLLRDVADIREHLMVGHAAYCLECGGCINDTAGLFCDDCPGGGYVECADCGERLRANDAFEIDDEWFCRDCVNYCDWCEEYTREEVVGVCNYRGVVTMYVCESCIHNNDFHECCTCGEYFEDDNMRQDSDGNYHCINCIDRFFYQCESCGDYVKYDDSEEIGGYYYCSCCAEDIKAANDETVSA